MLGIDVGSSFIKSAVLDLESGGLKYEQICPTPPFIDTTGVKREISMERIADQVKSLIDEALSLCPVAGVVFSVQMHGFQLFSGGKTLSDYVSWQDMRGSGLNGEGDIAFRIKNLAGEELLMRNGVSLRNSHSLCPLYHLMGEKRFAGPVQFSMLGDALIRFLTGELSPIHPTVAASSALYDLKKQDWNRELIETLSLENIQFPPVYGGKEPAAYYERSGRKIPLYTAVGDHQAAILGCGAGDGDIVINIGTGGQISYVDAGLSFGEYETRPYFSGRNLRALTQLPSGRSLNIFTNLILDTGNRIFGANTKADSKFWDRLNTLAEEAVSRDDGPRLDLDMSFFDPGGGSIRGIDTRNLNAGSLFAAVYRNMADSYFSAFGQLEIEGDAPRNIIGAGGVFRKTPVLRQILADRFTAPLRPSPCSEDVMIGLLHLARWYAGNRDEILPSTAVRQAENRNMMREL
ncbi:MAG: hypothetical protein LBH26_04730 [Treponema sp.]|jgi:sugar (pentulose or hexulose) kinase|nr:hypothetical protein [Treponema sp.]